MATDLIHLVESHDYQELFMLHLRWSRPDMPVFSINIDEELVSVTNVSSYKGLRVWVCPALPSASQQAAVDRAVAKQSVDRIVIFHNAEKQIWRWPSRTAKGGSITTRLTSHLHVRGMKNPKLVERLKLITLGPAESLGATDVVERVKQAFDVETERETKRASKLMAAMFDALKQAGTPEHDVSVTLARILFLMFGDDTDMWDKDLFQNFILNHTRPDGTDLADQLNALFEFLDTKPEHRGVTAAQFANFKYVNGGIFQETIVLPPVAKGFRDTILDATNTDWAEISPAIFGSMFQSVRDSKTRREFGEHYTSEKDILKTLNPLFLDELREELGQALDHREEYSRLLKLRTRLGQINFLDPACGCGNFIIIAYRELRMLEIAILERIRLKEATRIVTLAPDQLEFGLAGELDADGMSRTTLLDPVVRLDNFYGIEIDEWPAKIAETAMFLMDRQCDLQMLDRLGYAPERLPIQRQATIVTGTTENRDGGNALRLNWQDVLPPSENVIIAGNPPFGGQGKMSGQQVDDLKSAWGDKRYQGYLDLVTGWYIKTMHYFGDIKARWAFVSTSSISQGEPVPALFEPIFEAGWRIRFAHRAFNWTSEASGKAGVHVSILGFDRENGKAELYTYVGAGKGEPEKKIAATINAYLVDGPNVLVTSRSRPLSPALPPVAKGVQPTDGGNLIVEARDYAEVMADPHAAKYVRPFVGAKELVHNKPRWCLWLKPVDMRDVEESALLKERIAKVRELRELSTDREARDGASRPHELLRARLQPKDNYLAIPRHVGESRPYFLAQYFGPEVVNSDANFTAVDPDGFLFGLLSSSLFITWQRTVGGRIRADLRFANTLAWNNFPVPAKVPESLREAVVAAAKELLNARQSQSGASLAEMYDPEAMDPDLMRAHQMLDIAVYELFGAKKELDTEAERQELLFQEYAKLLQTRR